MAKGVPGNERRKASPRRLAALIALMPVFRMVAPLTRLWLRRRRPELERFLRIDDLAESAYRESRWGEAEALAKEGLMLVERCRRNWNRGNVAHNSHQILGLLRLREGDLEGAREHLLAAGRTPGSPQLNSFGPRLVLAREMFHRGERRVVLDYLDLVARFWAVEREGRPHGLARQHQRLLQRWRADIQAGRLPEHENWRGEV